MNLYEMFDNSRKLTLIDALGDFLPLAMNHLNISVLPKITFQKDVYSAEHPTFGRFTNDSKVVFVDVENRHPNDILRTLAHELTHFAQNERGELDQHSGDTGSDAENEANATAGVIMRNFNKKFPQYLKLEPVLLPAPQIDEGFMRNAALVMALASTLTSIPAQADETTNAVGQAIGIARQINRMKGYGPDAVQAEAYQELQNLIRAIGGRGNNYSKIYPHIKGMIDAQGPLPTEVEQLPPLTDEPINEKWSNKYKRSINCNNPKGFSQRAHCQGRKKANEDTCETHKSPSGRMTNMCPDDDDYEINYGPQGAASANENFADGKKPGRKGLAKRVGVDCGQSISKLRSIAKSSSGERQRMAHWCANMKSGKKK
jgi:hypothetical protein